MKGVASSSQTRRLRHTYVYDMSSSVKHQVSVVSVFDLQQEANNGVCSHAFYKVSSSLKAVKQPSVTMKEITSKH